MSHMFYRPLAEVPVEELKSLLAYCQQVGISPNSLSAYAEAVDIASEAKENGCSVGEAYETAVSCAEDDFTDEVAELYGDVRMLLEKMGEL